MAVADRHGLPVAVHIESATPHEVKLVVPTLVEMVIPEAPQNLVGDNAYDSDMATKILDLLCDLSRAITSESFCGVVRTSAQLKAMIRQGEN